MRAQLVATLVLTLALAGCNGDNDDGADGTCTRAVSWRETPMHAEIETDHGAIQVELHTEQAPITTCNFVGLVELRFYDNTRIHRVLPGFVIQAGGCDPNLNPLDPPFDPIKNEAKDSGLKNTKHTLSMARTKAADSATTQFFINLRNNPGLDPGGSTEAGYAVFATVTGGTDTVDSIAAVAVDTPDDPGPCRLDEESSPIQPVLIHTVRIIPSPA